MLADKKEEQEVLFKDIIYKRLNVREAELTARAIAQDRARKPLHPNPEFTRIEREFVERLGTRVRIDQREKGGKIIISFFSDEDLQKILDSFGEGKERGAFPVAPPSENEMPFSAEGGEGSVLPQVAPEQEPQFLTAVADEPATPEKNNNDDEEYLYSVKNFTV
ncbi:MAG: ParB/RepB/Spo0J family partition protein [Parcubacteria group bacterium]|nr:ParB/RepB/Spo0J family partition protein [Parcubacteria group bacterium]